MNPSLARRGFCCFKNTKKTAKNTLRFYSIHAFKLLKINGKQKIDYSKNIFSLHPYRPIYSTQPFICQSPYSHNGGVSMIRFAVGNS